MLRALVEAIRQSRYRAADNECRQEAATTMTRVRMVKNGPLMVEGPVEIEMPDGRIVESNRTTVALCMCKRSKTFPLCDTSHRTRR